MIRGYPSTWWARVWARYWTRDRSWVFNIRVLYSWVGVWDGKTLRVCARCHPYLQLVQEAREDLAFNLRYPRFSYLMPCIACWFDLVNLNLFVNLDNISCMCAPCFFNGVCTLFMFDLNLSHVSSFDLKSLCTCALGLKLWIHMQFQWLVWCHVHLGRDFSTLACARACMKTITSCFKKINLFW